MTSPFDDPDGTYSVLVNAAGQHALWPRSAEVPAGWTVAHGPAGRDACMDYVRTHWTDLRPRALAEHLDAVGRRPGPVSG